MSFYILLGFLAILFAFEYIFKPLLSFFWMVGVGGIGVWLLIKLVESLKEYVDQLERPRNEDPLVQVNSRRSEYDKTIQDPDHPLYALREEISQL